MKLTMRLTFFASVFSLCAATFAQSTNFATRVTCEVQSAYPELRDLVWLQGTTPAVQAVPMNAGKPMAYDSATSVRMVIGPSATGTNFAVRTNAATVTNGYAIQWPTIGTNTTSASNGWFYTLLFDRAGQTYWSGSGKLYIDATTSTASNRLEWIEYTIPSVDWAHIVGDPASSTSLVAYVESHSGGSAVDGVARTNAAEALEVGLAASNVASTAYGWGDHATNGYLSRYSSNTVIDAGTNSLFRNAGGQRYFVNNPSSPGDLLFSEANGLELDMNDGDIDGISDLQVATISKRPGGEAPVFPDGFSIGGTTYTNLNLYGGDASGWSGYAATQTVSLANNDLTDVGQLVVIHDIFSYGNIEIIGGGSILGLGNLTISNSLSLGGVSRTTWPEGGTGATFFVQGGTNVTVQTNGNNYVVSSGGGTVLYYNVTADSTAVGNYALARTNGTAVGTAAWADAYGAALGDTAYAPHSGAALGSDTLATDYGVAVGRGATAQHTNVAIGAGAQATGHNSVGIGAGAINAMDNTVLIGNTATTQTVARGTLIIDSIALGTNAPTSVWPQGGTGGTTNHFVGAGTTGLVTSTSGDTNKYLRGDGTWQTVQAGSSGGITNLVVNGFSVPQTNGEAYLSITTSGGVFASNTPGNVELFLSSFPAWAGVGSNRVSFTAITNSPQFFAVPSGVTNLAACVWGGGGWGGSCAGGSSFVSFPVTPGENLELRVALAPLAISITNDFVPGAWPGGGTGFRTNAGTVCQAGGYCGVFRGETPLVISGGGGVTSQSGSGGAGGGISGGGSSSGGGTQLAGGYSQSTNQTAGSYLQGGGALSTNVISWGGGGGYFGGGGCGINGNSGAGSGFVNGSLGVFGYTFRGQVGTELPEYITGKGGAGQSGLIVLRY